MARQAGVSTATVSRVVNNDHRISPATRQRVLDAVSLLNYKVNTVARSLKSKRTLSVGLIAPEIDNAFFMRVARGVEDRLGEEGYSMIVVNARESELREEAALELLLEKQVDGIIAIPSGNKGDHLALALQARVPLVLADRLVDNFTTDAVLVDNKDATCRAISRLAARGHRSFGFIGGQSHIFTARERYQGFMQALRDQGITPREEHILFGDFHIESGYRLMKDLMEQPDPPRTVMIANYFMHIGVIRYISFQRSMVPPDLYLAAFDNMEFSAVSNVPSLSIAQPIDQIGRHAAERVLQRIQGNTENWPWIERLPTEEITYNDPSNDGS
ncbi:LacI family DNA-binding transcriptional regulator [Alkalispirochaeta americana]|uniref:LacI family DNA-binding transcriptional regulator n=1 Tax=Alkalispirochaeta americana TaxID=159291 RepID=UPI0013567149|nr:LacI family DNA-binding transcriptional regulator [Alkalispirochaeta americana]